jgi:phosphoribosylformimino-5-aminoimidazole carboxamide ribotide isomerase
MQIIPVMDLLGGRVVRAVAGERENYAPIRSRLTNSADPADLATALVQSCGATSFYVADLDAITCNGSDRHFNLLRQLCPALASAGVRELWLDAGPAAWLGELAPHALAAGLRLVPVVGSESLEEGACGLAPAGFGPEEFVLSLDYRNGRFFGPPALDDQAARWPGRVIVMELAVVGTGAGPALGRLERICGTAEAAGRQDIAVFAAGGVRDAADLDCLAAAGAAGVLVASALHDGRLATGTGR